MGGLLGQLFGITEKDVLYTGLSLTHGNAQGLTLSISLIAGIDWDGGMDRRFMLSSYDNEADKRTMWETEDA